MRTLTIFPYQEAHLDVLKKHLNKSPFALDLSMLGTGKTYTSAKLGADLGMKHIIVICPLSVKAKWHYMKDTYGIPLHRCMSFCELRSCKGKQPKHGLLNRRDYQEKVLINDQEVTFDRVAFEANAAFKTLVNEGLLLVIDEIQNIKNVSSQFLAAQALSAEIIKHGVNGKSRLLLVSGSPIDKKEHTINMFRCLGIMKSQLTTYDIGTYEYNPAGMLEIEAYCNRLQPGHPFKHGRKNTILSPYDKRFCTDYAYKLFQNVFKPNLSNAMNPPFSCVELIKRNGRFIIEREEDLAQLTAGIEQLQLMTRYNAANNTVHVGANLAPIMTALFEIETAKTHTFARLAMGALDGDKNKKVVICVNYTATLWKLMELLGHYNPIVLHGAMNSNSRAKVIELFQERNCKHRLLISNLTVCSTGIDLDDKDGAFPREVFISPMYNTITLYQLCHRFQRMDTRSSSTIYMVYGKDAVESNIIAALARKSQVMKETTENQVKYGVEFPGDYATVVEDYDGKMVAMVDGFTN